MKRYRLSSLAELDLEEIWLYVARDSGVALADRFIHVIARGLDLLAAHPDAGRARDEIASGLRSFPVKSYVIYYRTSEQGVLVSRVLHGKRDQEAVLDPKA